MGVNATRKANTAETNSDRDGLLGQPRPAVTAEFARPDGLVTLRTDDLRRGRCGRLGLRSDVQRRAARGAEARLFVVEHAAARTGHAVSHRRLSLPRSDLGAIAIDGIPDLLVEREVAYPAQEREYQQRREEDRSDEHTAQPRVVQIEPVRLPDGDVHAVGRAHNAHADRVADAAPAPVRHVADLHQHLVALPDLLRYHAVALVERADEKVGQAVGVHGPPVDALFPLCCSFSRFPPSSPRPPPTLTLRTANTVGFLLRWGVPPSVVLPPLHKRLGSPCAPRRAGARPNL